ATIGGIGVSGGNAPGRDDDIARAGIAILEAGGVLVPPTRHPPQYQQTPAYIPARPAPIQPTPAYPSASLPPQPVPGSEVQGASVTSTVNLDVQQELNSQENPYGD